MELRTHGLALNLTFGPSDEEGWIPCSAVVNVPGFRGEFDFCMLKTDLEFFRSQLAPAIGGGGWPTSARLASTDPGIDLSWQIERTGQIHGRYRFVQGLDGPELSGGFVADQTLLRPLLVQVERILAELG